MLMAENDRQQDKERRTMNNILNMQHISYVHVSSVILLLIRKCVTSDVS